MHYSSAFGYAFTSFDFGQLRSPQPENQTQPSERPSKEHPNSRNDNIIWSDRRDRPIELYLHCLQEKSNRKPTPDKIKYAQDIAHTFHYFSQNKVIILDRDQDFKVIAMIEFTPLENLSASQKVKLNTVAMFLEEVKKYLATESEAVNITGGAFVLPNQRCGIDFSKQNGLVKMIWRANQYPHCTLPAVNHGCHTRIGISLQVSKKTASASREITNGEIMNRTTNRDKKPEDIYGYASKSVDLLQSLKLPDSHTTPSNGENISPLSTVTDDLNTLVTS
ncbi:hypothetical protein KEM48_007777 [Puccinia striiformis f. sp. tritici PST-130]|nr:hypothetical protein KEM48_007777 [Puccinia striiformis f. sp. tritici PST-130]